MAAPSEPDSRLASTALAARACWGCGGGGTKLLVCGRCRVALFCGAACQKAEWKAGHKRACDGLRRTREAVDARLSVRERPHGAEGGRSLVARVAIAAGEEIFRERPLMSSPFPAAEQVQPPEAVLELARLLARRGDPPLHATEPNLEMARTVAEGLTDAGGDELEALVLRAGRVLTNCFRAGVTVTLRDSPGAEPRLSERSHDATLLLPHVSLVNHSCWPSACQHILADNTARIVAIRDLAPGDEVTICYHSSLFACARDERRAVLRRTWSFDCACERCAGEGEGGWPAESVLTGGGAAWDGAKMAELERVRPGRYRDAAWAGALEALADSVPDTHGRGFAARSALVEHLLGRGDSKAALPHLWRVIAAARALMPRLQLSKLRWLNTAREQDPEAFAERAREAEPDAGALLRAFADE